MPGLALISLELVRDAMLVVELVLVLVGQIGTFFP